MEKMDEAVLSVRFAPGTKNNITFTPLAKTKKSVLRKLWLERCRKAEYAELQQDLDRLVQNEGLQIERFFSEEGKVLLDWALIKTPKVDGFRFICEHVPQELIQAILEDNDFSLIKSFVFTETDLERNRHMSSEQLNARLEKIKLLLTIGSRDLRLFLEGYLREVDSAGEGIKKSIQCALSTAPLKY